MVHVVAEVLVYQRMVRKVWPVPFRRKVLELQPCRGRVDVQGLVTRGAAVRVGKVPVSADVVRLLEAVVGDPEVLEAFGCGESGAACADDAHRWGVHATSSLLWCVTPWQFTDTLSSE